MIDKFERIKCVCKSKMFELYTDGIETKIKCKKCKRYVASVYRKSAL